MTQGPLVSIVIPTKNSARFLRATLESIRNQDYEPIETIIVDGQSTDDTLALAREFGCRVIDYDPAVPAGTFDAPHRRNYGVKNATGHYVYYVDADMELSASVVSECVALCQSGTDAVIVPEDSFGKGPWAMAKQLERRCYWGDDTVEAPRFFVKSVWDALGGLDESLGGGGDDWDMHQKLIEKNASVRRAGGIVMHNEGELQLAKLCKKRFMYGRDSAKYVAKRPKAGVKTYFPIRRSYVRNWRMFAGRPKDAAFFVVMRTAEYGAGGLGILHTLATSRRRPNA